MSTQFAPSDVQGVTDGVVMLAGLSPNSSMMNRANTAKAGPAKVATAVRKAYQRSRRQPPDVRLVRIKAPTYDSHDHSPSTAGSGSDTGTSRGGRMTSATRIWADPLPPGTSARLPGVGIGLRVSEQGRDLLDVGHLAQPVLVAVPHRVLLRDARRRGWLIMLSAIFAMPART